jgi:hypothetical protein
LSYFLGLIFALINVICYHQYHLLLWIAHLTVRSSQSNEPKIKIQKLKSHELPTQCHLFSYIKRNMRDRERKKKERRETEENKNRNSTISTSNDNNFWYKISIEMCYAVVTVIVRAKQYHLDLQKHIWSLFEVFSSFFYFFLKNCIGFHFIEQVRCIVQ